MPVHFKVNKQATLKCNDPHIMALQHITQLDYFVVNHQNCNDPHIKTHKHLNTAMFLKSAKVGFVIVGPNIERSQNCTTS